MGELAVVGQEQQSLGILVQPSHGGQADAAQIMWQKIQNGGLPPILGGGEYAAGLVQQDIGEPAERNGLPRHGDLRRIRVDLVLGGGGQHPVDTHQTLSYQGFHLFARPPPGGGQHLVKTLHECTPSAFLSYDSIFRGGWK